VVSTGGTGTVKKVRTLVVWLLFLAVAEIEGT